MDSLGVTAAMSRKASAPSKPTVRRKIPGGGKTSGGGRKTRPNVKTSDIGFHVPVGETALVIIDPQNDFLSPQGTTWSLVGRSVTETGIIEHLDQLLRAAKRHNYPVFISPHYFYPTDSTWKFNGPLEALEARTSTFARRGPLSLTGFPSSGADWHPRLNFQKSHVFKIGARSFRRAASIWR